MMIQKKKFVFYSAIAIVFGVIGLLFTNAVDGPVDECSGSQLCKNIYETIEGLQKGKQIPEYPPGILPLSNAVLMDHASNVFGFGISSYVSDITPNQATDQNLKKMIASIARDVEAGRPFTSPRLRELASAFEFSTKNFGIKFNPILMGPLEIRKAVYEIQIKRLADGSNVQQVSEDIGFLMIRTREAAARFRLLVNAFGAQTSSGIRIVDNQVNFSAVLQDFWFNHFNVDLLKVSLDAAVGVRGRGGYEEMIHNRMRSTFYNLLKGVINHTAMLIYLDNQSNVFRLNTLSASNQNLGRELVELHVLGIGPGRLYGQSDIEASALMLTGINVATRMVNGTFSYGTELRPLNHVPDYVIVDKEKKQVAPVFMGRRFCLHSSQDVAANQNCPEPRSPEKDVEVLRQRMSARQDRFFRFLASHPRTKAFICSKLTSRFLAGFNVPSGREDNPDTYVNESLKEIQHASVAARCREAWGEVGDLQAMYAAILTSPELWNRTNYGRRLKNPMELATSAVRLAGITAYHIQSSEVLSFATSLHNEVVYVGLPYRYWATPTGYPHNSGWYSGGHYVRWTQASFRLASILESISKGVESAPVMGLRYGFGLNGSFESYAKQHLSSGAERLEFAHRLFGIGPLRRSPASVTSKMISYLNDPDGEMIVRQKIENVVEKVPIKTALTLKLSNLAFYLK